MLGGGAPPASWTKNIAAHIKSLAPSTLILDGTDGLTTYGGDLGNTGVGLSSVDLVYVFASFDLSSRFAPAQLLKNASFFPLSPDRLDQNRPLLSGAAVALGEGQGVDEQQEGAGVLRRRARLDGSGTSRVYSQRASLAT